ncbi:MAG: TetR/AcrR family transcriptional regulator [Leptospirales bacterium]
MTLSGNRVKDRRIQKTQKLLHEALFSLIHEKDYDSIIVKEILDRANVGRSTFYLHFGDKDELLVSGMHDMLRSVQAADLSPSVKSFERIIWFSLPIFKHIHQHRADGESRIGTRGRAIIHEHLQKVLGDLIADSVEKNVQNRRQMVTRIPSDMIVQYVASTFILVLNWWLENKNQLTPEKINDLFRGLILPTLSSILE